MNKIRFAGILLSVMLFVLPLMSLAQGPSSIDFNPQNSAGKIDNPLKVDSITGLLKLFLTGLIKIGFPLIALAIIYSGFLFVFARGNSEKLENAKRSLLYTLIGAAILLGSWAIATLILETVLNLGS